MPGRCRPVLPALIMSSAGVIAIASPARAATIERRASIVVEQQGSWRVGDKVEAYNTAWYNATIVEIGSGDYAGYYKVRFDNYASEQWLKASSIRARQGADTAPTRADDAAAVSAWKPGDKVLAWNVTWYPATVLEIGSGTYAGYIKVHYDGSSSASDQYLRGTSIKARPDARAEAVAAEVAQRAGPRLGRYRILSYGAGGSSLMLGELELRSDGRYRAAVVGGRVIGEGRYDYDAATATVRWLSGPYQTDGWGGKFTVERNGKTHQIRLRPNTIAVNSID